MRMLLTTASWPIWAGFLLMIVAAVIDARTTRVPNALTVPCLLGGLVIAVLWGQGGVWPSLGGGIGASVGTAALTLLVLFVMYRFWRIPGGALKMQVVFAAWLGCALPLGKALSSSLAAVAVIVLVYLVFYLVFRYARPTSDEEEARRPPRVRYGWTALLNVVTILVLDWLRLV